jgi:hypothetical protein
MVPYRGSANLLLSRDRADHFLRSTQNIKSVTRSPKDRVPRLVRFCKALGGGNLNSIVDRICVTSARCTFRRPVLPRLRRIRQAQMHGLVPVGQHGLGLPSASSSPPSLPLTTSYVHASRYICRSASPSLSAERKRATRRRTRYLHEKPNNSSSSIRNLT